MRRRVLAAVVLACCASAFVVSGARTATPAWGKIGALGIGMLEQAVIYHQGLGRQESCTSKGCADVRGYGTVQVVFEHGRVASVDCAAPGSLAGRGCPAGFVLPDGVALGTPVPFASSWRGYVRYQPPDAQYDLFSWKKQVRLGGRAIVVYLTVEKGRVIGIGESAV